VIVLLSFAAARLVVRRSTGELKEIVVSRWSDGSSCDLSNCFLSVEFEADCVAHGPFSTTVSTAHTSSCACISGYARVNAATDRGGWQCEQHPAKNHSPTAATHDASKIFGVCALVRHCQVLAAACFCCVSVFGLTQVCFMGAGGCVCGGWCYGGEVTPSPTGGRCCTRFARQALAVNYTGVAGLQLTSNQETAQGELVSCIL
jgi:hypothetical protein